MKQFLLTIFLLLVLAALYAQDGEPAQETQHYIFPSFAEGTVKHKSGEVIKALLNYNTVTEEMIFDQNGKKLALDKIENIDTVYIQNRKFVPVSNVFYERATNTINALFIQHKSLFIPPGNNTGFGTSQTAAISNIADLKALGLAYKLKLPDDFKILSKTVYWVKKNNNYYILRTQKNLEDLFPERADAIKKYVKANKINFKKPDDLMKVVIFCN